MIVYFWDGEKVVPYEYNLGMRPGLEFQGQTCVYLAPFSKSVQYRDWTSQGWRITNEPDIPKELKAFALLLT